MHVCPTSDLECNINKKNCCLIIMIIIIITIVILVVMGQKIMDWHWTVLRGCLRLLRCGPAGCVGSVFHGKMDLMALISVSLFPPLKEKPQPESSRTAETWALTVSRTGCGLAVQQALRHAGRQIKMLPTVNCVGCESPDTAGATALHPEDAGATRRSTVSVVSPR